MENRIGMISYLKAIYKESWVAIKTRVILMTHDRLTYYDFLNYGRNNELLQRNRRGSKLAFKKLELSTVS